MRSTVFAILVLLALSLQASAAKTVGVSGKYYRFTTANGVTKVHREQYLDFQADGRCASRAPKTDAHGTLRYNTVILSYDVSGNYVEIVGEFGFTVFEVSGNRLVSGSGGYVKSSSVDPVGNTRKPATKPIRKVSPKK